MYIVAKIQYSDTHEINRDSSDAVFKKEKVYSELSETQI